MSAAAASIHALSRFILPCMSHSQPAADSTRSAAHPWELLTPQRRIQGISAILLPFDAAGFVDFAIPATGI
ncbi:hypothetical protein EBU58_08920 [bacterium]|nr:hypothetical protein [bacterium]